MPRQPRDASLGNREARLKLKPRKHPYQCRVVPGLFLGYRRRTNGAGSWVARRLIDGTKRYSERAFAVADDYVDADGIDILNFKEAFLKAQEIVADYDNQPAKENVFLTVEKVLDDYWEHYSSGRDDSKTQQTQSKLDRIKASPLLRGKLVSELTARDIERWLNSLVKEKPKRAHGRSGETQAKSIPEKDSPEYADYLRKRKCTANSYLSILKAALNRAWRLGQIPSKEAWTRVRPFPNVSEAKIRFLSLVEVERLLKACPEAFRTLVQGALETGARYGELTSLTVSDYLPDAQVVHFPANITKNRKARSVPLTDSGVSFFDSLTAGRSGEERIFLKSNGEHWVRSEQGPHMKRACKKAKISPPISFHILRHTTASLLVQAGTPLQVVSTMLGHSDTRITQKHYAHLCPDYVAETVRANLPTFGTEKPKVIPISRVQANSGRYSAAGK